MSPINEGDYIYDENNSPKGITELLAEKGIDISVDSGDHITAEEIAQLIEQNGGNASEISKGNYVDDATLRKAIDSIPTNPENMIVFYTDPAPTEHQVCDGTNGSPNLIDSFPRGSTNQGTKQGSNTHLDQSSGTFNTSTYHDDRRKAGDSFFWGGNTSEYAEYGHTHTIPDHSHGEADHTPQFLALIPAMINDKKIYNGAHILYRGTTLPSGWSFITGYSGKFLRGRDSTTTGYVTGGNSQHQHPNSGTLYTSYVPSQHLIDGAPGTKDGTGNHRHHNSHGTNSVDNNPSHVELSLIKSDIDNPHIPSNAVAFFSGSSVDLPDDWLLCDGNNDTPDYQSVLIKIIDAYNDDLKKGNDTHEDISPSSYTNEITDNSWDDAGGNDGPKDHYHGVPQHSHGINSSLPVHTPLVIAMKVE